MTPAGEHRRGSTPLLILLCLAQFMVILDVSIVNVALPSIRDGLGFSTAALAWVIDAYAIVFAGFLLLGGRSADVLGARRTFLAGTILFSAASLAAALAQTEGMLLVARAIQGLGAAVISPSSLAVITHSFSEGRERTRAVGVWGAMAGLGGTSGALAGGLLTQAIGWEAIFLVNIPIGIGVLVLGPRLIPADPPSESERKHFDALGAVLVTAGLSSLVFGIVRTDVLSWGSPGVLVPIALAAALIAAFVYVEARVAERPLMPLEIFKRPALRTANIAMLLLAATTFSMWFLVSLYLQQVLGSGPLLTGVQFLPLTLSVVAGTIVATRVINRVGPRPVLVGGLLSTSLGLALLSGVSPDGGYFLNTVPGGMFTTFGLGLAMVAATVSAVQGVPGNEAGLASGLINTSRMVGGSIGVAALTTLAATHSKTLLESGHSQADALSSGFDLAFTVAAIATFAAAILTAALLRSDSARVRTAANEAQGAVS
jgi:EmrB/QacA subfamily drug resistance transporter